MAVKTCSWIPRLANSLRILLLNDIWKSLESVKMNNCKNFSLSRDQIPLIYIYACVCSHASRVARNRLKYLLADWLDLFYFYFLLDFSFHLLFLFILFLACMQFSFFLFYFIFSRIFVLVFVCFMAACRRSLSELAFPALYIPHCFDAMPYLFLDLLYNIVSFQETLNFFF